MIVGTRPLLAINSVLAVLSTMDLVRAAWFGGHVSWKFLRGPILLGAATKAFLKPLNEAVLVMCPRGKAPFPPRIFFVRRYLPRVSGSLTAGRFTSCK